MANRRVNFFTIERFNGLEYALSPDLEDVAVWSRLTRMHQRGSCMNVMNDQANTNEEALEALRRAELRYRSIFENCLEGIFQTTPDGKYLCANPALARIYGYESADDLIAALTDIGNQLYVEPARRAEFIRLVRQEGKVIDFESQVYRRDRGVIWISENARVVRDEVSGEVLYYEGMVQDITRRKAAEAERDQANARLSVQYAVARSLAEVRHLGDASKKIVQAICESMHWDFGGLWRVDPTATLLRCVDTWERPGFSAPEFIEATRQSAFPPGVGLPGRVWSSRKAFWIPDVVVDDHFVRAELAVCGGLHGALAFPIMRGDEVIGVMEFFSKRIYTPDDDLLSMLTALGTQIGSFVERERMADQLALYASASSHK
jgi:PAS domain S-box-containing protein